MREITSTSHTTVLKQWDGDHLAKTQPLNSADTRTSTSELFISEDEDFQITSDMALCDRFDCDNLKLDSAHFARVAFDHILVPQVTMDWRRGGKTAQDIIVIFQLLGQCTISSDAQLLRRDPEITVVFPCESTVQLKTAEPLNEFIVIGLDTQLCTKDITSTPASDPLPYLDIASFKPMFAFITDLCATENIMQQTAANIENAAETIASSLLFSVLGKQLA